MKTSEIFIHQSIKQLGSVNQWIVTSRNNQTTIINTYSFDQFHPFRLVPEHHRRQCKEFQLRQQYALPHTPKIILVKSKQKNNGQFLLLAQRGQFQFHRFIHHYQNDQKSQIDLALKIVITAQMLQKKYGYFRLTQSMIKASRGPSMLIWMSENQVNNQPQFPIGPFYQINLQNKNSQTQNNKNPMEIMIRSIFEILVKNFSHNKTLIDILDISSELLTFEEVKGRLNQSIKDQMISNCTIISENCDKNRRNTEQKRRKIPEFLLNKNIIKAKQMETNKTVEYAPNNNIISTLFSKQIPKNEQSRQVLLKKIANTKIFHLKRAQNQDNVLGNDSIKTKDTRQNQITSKESIKDQQESIRFRKPYHTIHEQTPIEILNKQKPVVRQSGKSVSTSCAQYFSINSSGKKTILQNISTQDDIALSFIKKKDKKQNTKLIRYSFKREEPKHSSFYQEHIKPQVLVSKIMEQNNEDNQIQSQSQSQSTRSPRSPSILGTIPNNNTIYQKSINSPGSEFFKDVDNLLHSGAISRQVQSEIDKSMQGELHRILFD